MLLYRFMKSGQILLIPRIKTMIPMLDEVIGGLIPGGVTIFTGKAGDGKSTLCGQLLLNGVEPV